jgi:mycothiol S-conjugate amidase
MGGSDRLGPAAGRVGTDGGPGAGSAAGEDVVAIDNNGRMPASHDDAPSRVSSGAPGTGGGAAPTPTAGAPDQTIIGEPRRLRLMAVHAHPDDESSKGAASMARYAHEGVDVLVVTCTGGEAGSILNPAMDTPEIRARMPGLRREEMERAREILGVRQHWLGFVDSGLPEGEPPPPLPPGCFALTPLADASRPLVRLVREFRPHVITTYDENGGYPHPDHIMTHKISVEAFEAAGDADRYPEVGTDVGLAPWQPLKLYYHLTFHKQRILALHQAMLDAGLESPYAERLSEWVDRAEDTGRLTTKVRCDEWFTTRDAALLAHATQVDPQGSWFRVPIDLQRAVWPTEDYQLARSLVEVGTLPETDLFIGIPAPDLTAIP